MSRVPSPSHAQGLSSPSRTSPLPAAAPGLFEVTNARSLGCRRESQVGGTADSTWSEGPRAPTPLTSVSTCTDTRLSLHTAVAQHLKTSSPLVSAPACRRPTQFERPRAARPRTRRERNGTDPKWVRQVYTPTTLRRNLSPYRANEEDAENRH